MPRVSRSTLSPASPLFSRVASEDFIDCFSVPSTVPARKAAEIITDFPVWAKILVALRGIAMAPFGVLAHGPDASDKLGEFPVELETDHEVIAGFNDKHLDFRVSVRSEAGQVSLATWVRRHNLLGRVYLTLILPFHILIARNALARVAASDAAGQAG